MTEVHFTEKYAHPELREQVRRSSDPDAQRAPIPREQLRPAYDLFALGRTMQEVLSRLRTSRRQQEVPPPFTDYDWQYLNLVSKRLLDGRIQQTGEDPVLADVAPGLREREMVELKYGAADEALRDLEKLLHFYDLEGVVEELNPHIASHIRVAHANVPLTGRVKAVIDHPSFRRLARVTQLGFVSWVYPGATHTRFEHALGTFTRCCDYLRALWYDETSCLFQCIMSDYHLRVALLAALLHDIAQYPMAHDLAEISTRFAHERFTAPLLLEPAPDGGESLADVITAQWGVKLEDVLSTMEGSESASLQYRILHSLISGPIDCDKLDYLKRDATHLGVTYGAAIDEERLLRYLTVVHGLVLRPDGEQYVAEIGVAEKAIAVVETIIRTRQEMFRQVYWHHSVRSLKAMLAFVIRHTLNRIENALHGDHPEAAATEQEAFWTALSRFACTGRFDQAQGSQCLTHGEPSKPAEPEWLQAMSADAGGDMYGGLAPTDEDLLRLLDCFAKGEAATILRALRNRDLYHRVGVISHNRHPEAYEGLYMTFWTYRIHGQLQQIEDQRVRWEQAIIEEVEAKLSTSPELLPNDVGEKEVIARMRQTRPLILVDVPIKALAKGRSARALWFVPESSGGTPGSHTGYGIAEAPVELDDAAFDKRVGKVRVFGHHDWYRLLAGCLTDKDMVEILHA